MTARSRLARARPPSRPRPAGSAPRAAVPEDAAPRVRPQRGQVARQPLVVGVEHRHPLLRGGAIAVLRAAPFALVDLVAETRAPARGGARGVSSAEQSSTTDHLGGRPGALRQGAAHGPRHQVGSGCRPG